MNSIIKESKLNENFDFGLLLNIIYKSRYYIFLTFLISFIAVFIYLRYGSVVYESSAIIKINSDNTARKIINFDEK